MMAQLKSVTKPKILVVDDTPDNLRVLAKMLESQHYIVCKALNGKMALQAARHNPPDLILLDINMPEMNGYEVCQQLKNSETTAQIPIIFISALDQVSDKVRAFELGGRDYITKPFQTQEVLARLQSQLLIQQQQRQLQQAEAEVRQLNADLEQRIQARTLELQQSLSFELALKRISDQVRDSLNQHHVLQAVVETLAWALDVHGCDAALYDAAHVTSTIRYQWVQPGAEATQGQMLYMADFPELYKQLQERTCFAFCQTQPSPIRNHSAILACPMFDDAVDATGILGDLWIFREPGSSFTEIEVRLVQQAANQCAIALRQARLYEAAQAQVRELTRLNQLKDDFLSTISHELRTPITSIKMVIKLLATVTNEGKSFIEEITKSPVQNNKVIQYFKVLQDECDRELALVEDLLSLQSIEAGTYTPQPTLINLQDFIPHLVEQFESRTQTQQQTLQIGIAPNLPSLNLDSKSLARILTELLTNACKYTPAGETISLSVSMTQDTEVPNLMHYLNLAVINTGVEIPAEELARIFDKFYRIPSNDPWKHGGTGLGLALVKKLVEQIGGSMTVESINNQTCFTVWLKIF